MAFSSSDMRPVTSAPETTRFAQLILVIGSVLVLVSFLRILAPLGMGLRLSGLGLIFAGSATLAWKLLSTVRDQEVRAMVMDLVALDAMPALLTRNSLDNVDRNQAAVTAYGNASLIDILSGFVANPRALTDKMTAAMRSEHIARNEVITPHGVLSLSARRVGDDLIIWRLVSQPVSGQSDHPAARHVMALVAASDGSILSMSQALQARLEQRCAHLRDAFEDPSLQSGANWLLTDGGATPVTVQVHQADQALREILVFPRETVDARPTESSAELVEQEQLPVPLLHLALDGRILNANLAAQKLLRSDVGPGAKLSDFVEGLGRPMVDWIAEAASAEGNSQPQFLRGTGERKNLFVQVALCRIQDEDSSNVIAVLHDVTEFKVLEAQFVQSQKMQAIGQLAGGVAHDFNNLLTAISGHCDLLLLRHDPDDPDYSDLTQIHQNANRAASLVGQLLAYSRKQELRLERVNMRDALADLTHLLNRLVGERITLSLKHDVALQSVMADKRQLEQVIMNLVVNARDAMEEGGQITLRTEALTLDAPMTRDQATVNAGKWALIHVEDCGTGIQPEMLPHVFEPFYTTKGVGEGTGLGLSTAYGIVKQSGGFIFVDSTPGKGSTFTIYLPAASEEPKETNDIVEAGKAMRAAPECGVVLLVEDEAPVRAFASRALKLRGYDVVEADCGEMALELLQDPSLKPDLIVSDVVMPGIDGPSWVSEALKTRPDVKVIFMSGYSESGIRENRQAIPNSAFLPKPFSLNDLLETVQTQMAG